MIEFIVTKHPSGRYTLMEKSGSRRVDLPGPLLGNPDKGNFYQAVAQHLAAQAISSINFTYSDTAN